MQLSPVALLSNFGVGEHAYGMYVGEVMDRVKTFLTSLIYRIWPEKQWFEDNVERDGFRYPRLSKFAQPEFSVSLTFLMTHWRGWSRKQKGTFASAFAFRPKLGPGDRELLDFLMDDGGAEAWSMIALLVAREYPDRDRALEFLLARVNERAPLLARRLRFSKANYYQALAVSGRTECVEELKNCLAKHRQYVRAHPSLHWWKMWRDTIIYLDYVSCCAALLRLTGEEEYRTNLKAMLGHHNTPVRQMVPGVATASGLIL